MLKIRAGKVEEVEEIRHLFQETIRHINARDYNEDQINTWSSGSEDIETWKNKIQEQHFLVAETDNIIAGFASVTAEGYIDLLFVHKDYQRQGIANELMKEIEKFALHHHISEIWSDVSLTAKPFFSNKGFEISKVYTKLFRAAAFENTIMVKDLRTEEMVFEGN